MDLTQHRSVIKRIPFINPATIGICSSLDRLYFAVLYFCLFFCFILSCSSVVLFCRWGIERVSRTQAGITAFFVADHQIVTPPHPRCSDYMHVSQDFLNLTVLLHSNTTGEKISKDQCYLALQASLSFLFLRRELVRKINCSHKVRLNLLFV